MEANRTIKAQCMDCGRQGTVDIAMSGKIRSKDRWYWGKLNIASLKTSKYWYELQFDPKTDKIREMKTGRLKTKRILNPHYDKRIKPKMVEMWSHAICVRESKKKQKKREKRLNTYANTR